METCIKDLGLLGAIFFPLVFRLEAATEECVSFLPSALEINVRFAAHS
jgi:hypothetical protein